MIRTNEIRMDSCSGPEFTRKEVKIAAPEPEIRLPALIERGIKAIFSSGKFRTEDVKKDVFPTFSGLHRALFCVIFLFANTVLQGGDPEKIVFRDESIFPCQEKHVHSSSIVECPSGDLLVCLVYGAGERTADDVLIQGARLRKGSGKWSEVFLMADTPGFPDCNPVLFIDPRERLWMFWIPVLAQ